MTQQTANQVRRLVAADTGMAPGEREAWTFALERGILEFAAQERASAAGAAAKTRAEPPLTCAEAAERLGVCKRTAMMWAKNGVLRKAVDMSGRGRTIFVTAASVEAVRTGALPRPKRGGARTRRAPGAMDFHAPPGNAANLSETGAATPCGARASGATSENRGMTR